MPFQLLDLILAGTVIISALLALSRGFTREALSLVAWVAAALAAIGAVLNPTLGALARNYVQPDVLATVGLGAIAFIAVLVIVSLIGVKIADWVLESGVGPLDRSLGLIYGVARGVLLVVVAYLFYGWLVPADKCEAWVKNAWSLPLIESTAEAITRLLPAELGDLLCAKPASETGTPATPADQGYHPGQTNGMNQLIEGTGATPDATQPASPAPAQQPTPGGNATDGQ